MKTELWCTIQQRVKSALTTLLLRNGCSECEASSISVEPGPLNGGGAALASVRASDGRELYRVYDLEDLDALLTDKSACASLAQTMRRLWRNENNTKSNKAATA